MKHKAIYNLYPNVKMIDESNNGSITAYNENREVVSIDMTLVNAKETELKAEMEQEKLNKEQSNQSAIDKLKALGLTDSEIEAFRGK